jgi:hypothetical protein
MSALVSEEMIAVTLTMPPLVEGFAVVGREHDDRAVGQPLSFERAEDSRARRIDARDRAVVEAADCATSSASGAASAPSPTGLSYLKRPRYGARVKRR